MRGTGDDCGSEGARGEVDGGESGGAEGTTCNTTCNTMQAVHWGEKRHTQGPLKYPV